MHKRELMETRLSSINKEIVISDQRPTVLIGERINPTGRKKLTQALTDNELEIITKEALAQVQAGADVLDVNVGVPGLDELAMLPRVVQAIMNAVDVPLCLDSSNTEALKAALKVYQGKPLVNSVTGEKHSLEAILPLVQEHKAAVVGLTMDDEGIPESSDKRLSIACKIVDQAEKLGIPREDVVIDCLSQTVAVNSNAGLVTLETVQKVKAELGVNITLELSNISFGLPNRRLLNNIFLAMAVAAGVTCPIVDVAQTREAVVSADLALGRDMYAQRYIQVYRSLGQQAV